MDTASLLDIFDPIVPDHPDDDPLMPFAEVVSTLVDYGGQVGDPRSGLVLTVDRVKLDTPIEIRPEVSADGTVRLKGAPPTQHTETTILPVFHQMTMTVELDNETLDTGAGQW